MTALLDEADRRRAVRERERNLIVEASAGTGKTSIVVDRIVELIAPTDGRDPIPIGRLAAITFTRKAAGELRVRTRQRLLEILAALAPDAPRAAPLLRALGGIDTAPIGTVHSFADRLLRKWPAHARLDPQYELHDDDAHLTEECFQLLVHAAEHRTLRELLRDHPAAERADEAIETILDAQRAGLPLRSRDTDHWTYHGLDGLVAGCLRQRDVDLEDPPSIEIDRARFERHADEYLALVDGLSSATSGGTWLLESGRILRHVRNEPDAAVVYSEIVDRFERGPRGRASDAPRRSDFAGDDRAWDVWKALAGDDRHESIRCGSLRDDLLAPLRRWMAVRLVRLRPVVLAIYELVKSRHHAVDHIDLLLRLRNLLRDDRAIRRACQGLFDHILVDEFQDTDPLQAEIILFLCEHGAEAAAWDAVKLAPGTLTVVGDPKQSIYRFRRADIATYARALDVIARAPYLHVHLTSSFRTAPALVDWLNTRFVGILGRAEQGERFRRDTGDVPYQPLTRGRNSGVDPTVHAVAMDLPDGGTVADHRVLEAATIARYLRWLVATSGITVVDPMTDQPRAIGYGDIGVLAIATTNLPLLFDAFDRDGIPHASLGGALFLADPLHRRFLLGLCALADRDDGVALAALLRPPFFAIDLGDLARSRADDPDDRATQARAIVSELRRCRFERSPGATARALLEDTALGRTVALGPNGLQRLAGLRELCFRLEARAFDEHLDFDAAVEHLRCWIDHPPRLDRPHPVGAGTVRVMTVHQAKGLEFPIVVLWDARAAWTEQTAHDPWTVERDNRGWALRLDTLTWDEPAGLDIAARERRMREAERKRLVYVAATRARDLLVVPKVGAPDDRWILGRLLGPSQSPTVLEQPLHTPQAHAPWFDAAAPVDPPLPAQTTQLDVELQQTWQVRAHDATRESMRPAAFAEAASPHTLWDQQGRFGTAFGETVHVALALALQTRCTAEHAVQRAALRTGLRTHVTEAVADVSRSLATLAAIGVPAHPYQLEYPVAGLAANGQLLAGYADLVVRMPDGIMLLDFKTDAPPADGQAIAQRYIDQVAGYATALGAGFGTSIRAGLLFTADGKIHWLSSHDHGRSHDQE